jgi:hypothetical protein
MVGEWLAQTVEVPLWGVFVLTAYSARRLARTASGLETLRRRPGTPDPDAVRDEHGSKSEPR